MHIMCSAFPLVWWSVDFSATKHYPFMSYNHKLAVACKVDYGGCCDVLFSCFWIIVVFILNHDIWPASQRQRFFVFYSVLILVWPFRTHSTTKRSESKIKWHISTMNSKKEVKVKMIDSWKTSSISFYCHQSRLNVNTCLCFTCIALCICNDIQTTNSDNSPPEKNSNAHT